MYVYMYVCTYVYIYVCMYLYIYIYISPCAIQAVLRKMDRVEWPFHRPCTHIYSTRPRRAQGRPQGPGQQWPRGAHVSLAHKGPGGSTRTQPARAHGSYKSHKGPRARATRAQVCLHWPGPQGPMGAHKGSGHTGPRGPMHAGVPASYGRPAQGCVPPGQPVNGTWPYL